MNAPEAFSRNDMKGVTQEEVSKLTKAMKDGQFREHMDEYCKEVSDPAHRAEYIQYLEQLEAKGEIPEGQQLLRSQPGCCVKTSIRFKNGQTQKLFINIVHCDRIDDIDFKPSETGEGRQVYLPYSLSPPRPDQNNRGEYCMTADCAVSSRTFYQAAQNAHILKMIVDTACDGLGSNFLKGFEEVRKDWKLMENLKCKGGFPMPMSVKAELLKDKGSKCHKPTASALEGDSITPSELKQMRDDAKSKRAADKAQSEGGDGEAAAAAARAARAREEEAAAAAPRIRVPRHRLIHSGSVDLADYMEAKNQPLPATTTVPKVLRLVVELPTVKKSSDVSLEVTCNNVVIEVPDKYYLDLPLSYEVEEMNGTAKFDKVKQELSLELPVVPKPPIFPPQGAGADISTGGSDGADDGCLREDDDCEDEDGFHKGPPQAPTGNDAAEEKDAGLAESHAADWVDRAALEIAEGRDAAEAEARETLEATGPMLQIAEPEVDDCLAMDKVPEFEPAAQFEGYRPGRYFGTSDQGLGYYRDLRWRPAKPEPKRQELERQAAEDHDKVRPLVEEMFPEAPLGANCPGRREELPPLLRRYVGATASLGRRLRAAEVQPAGGTSACPPEFACYQTGQNVCIAVDVPPSHEVADVQLSVTGHRMTLAFCSREASSDSSPSSPASGRQWTRHRLRQTLSGAVDARQWHATVVPGGPDAAADVAAAARGHLNSGDQALPDGQRLEVVLRKAHAGDMWPQVFTGALPPPEAVPFDLAPPDAPLASPVEAGLGGAATLNTPSQHGLGAPSDTSLDEGHCAQDSAELDVAAPDKASATLPGGAAAAQKATATPASVQSATVMGQSVILKTRLMYQLL